MNTEPKSFHISDLICVSHGRLVSSRGMEGVYDILSHMAGTNLYTHQLPEVGRQAEPVLREAHTFLNDIEVPEIHSEEEATAFIAEMVDKHGEYFAVSPLAVVSIPTFFEAVDLARKAREARSNADQQ